MRPTLLVAAVLVLAACSQPDTEEAAAGGETAPEPGGGAAPAASAELFGADAGATAELRNAQGGSVGRAEMMQTPDGLLVRVQAQGLTPGWHGLHLHAMGDCSDPAFQSAGGHVHDGPSGQHGLRNPAGPEAGDLPNLLVGTDGTGAAELHTRLTGLDRLMDADGSAILIHAGPDDHMTQPIGGSGDRIACGVITAAGSAGAAATGGSTPATPQP